MRSSCRTRGLMIACWSIPSVWSGYAWNSAREQTSAEREVGSRVGFRRYLPALNRRTWTLPGTLLWNPCRHPLLTILAADICTVPPHCITRGSKHTNKQWAVYVSFPFIFHKPSLWPFDCTCFAITADTWNRSGACSGLIHILTLPFRAFLPLHASTVAAVVTILMGH